MLLFKFYALKLRLFIQPYKKQPIKATCYNINDNNYFKLRDITDALDCRVEWDGKTQMIWVIPARTAHDDPDEIVG